MATVRPGESTAKRRHSKHRLQGQSKLNLVVIQEQHKQDSHSRWKGMQVQICFASMEICIVLLYILYINIQTYRRIGRQSKVNQFDFVILVKEYIFGFQISVSESTIVNVHQNTKQVLDNTSNFAFS